MRDEIDWFDAYLGKRVTLPTGTSIAFDEQACMRCAVKYGAAINHAVDLADHIRRCSEAAGRDLRDRAERR